MNSLMLIVILIPVLGAVSLPVFKIQNRRQRLTIVASALIAEAIAVTMLLFQPSMELTLFTMANTLAVKLRVDTLSKIFLAIGSYGFLITGFFAFRYMEHEEAEGAFSENTFFTFYLVTLGMLAGLDQASNLVTMYFFFELTTLLSMPMVLYERTKESIRAALKYLFYSIGGAFLALFAIFVFSQYTTSIEFAAGGTLDMAKISGHETLIYIASFLGIMGFGAKAGMYPLQGWLPSAHPVAPAPASAVLSGIIAKAGVLAILRLLYFIIGTAFLKDTWVQYALLSLSLLTVFVGSMMAFREKILKKRLAYSTISQISYALFGFFLMNPTGVQGGIMQILFHAIVKISLFLVAGSIIFNRKLHNVDELVGIGKIMPKTIGVFTMASLSLIGIPPFAGFLSKWYLAEGSLTSEIPVIRWLGPVILLVSALLTAGYLLPIMIKGFFPGKEGKDLKPADEGGPLMLVPLFILAALALFFGLFGGLFNGVYEALTNCMF